MAKGRDNKLFSNTIETSFRDPDLVACFALSMTRRRVSCHNVQLLHASLMAKFLKDLLKIDYSETKSQSREMFKEQLIPSSLLLGYNSQSAMHTLLCQMRDL